LRFLHPIQQKAIARTIKLTASVADMRYTAPEFMNST
jgi:hypothetical protein